MHGALDYAYPAVANPYAWCFGQRLPPEYNDKWRCDTHTCASHDGKMVIFDSPHGGDGREIYLVHISKLIVWAVNA